MQRPEAVYFPFFPLCDEMEGEAEGKRDLRGTNGALVVSASIPWVPLSRRKVAPRSRPQHGARHTIKASSMFVEW